VGGDGFHRRHDRLYVKRAASAANGNRTNEAVSLRAAWEQWQSDGRVFWQQMDTLVETLDGLGRAPVDDANHANRANCMARNSTLRAIAAILLAPISESRQYPGEACQKNCLRTWLHE
jgi:hypothetical protein